MNILLSLISVVPALSVIGTSNKTFCQDRCGFGCFIETVEIASRYLHAELVYTPNFLLPDQRIIC